MNPKAFIVTLDRGRTFFLSVNSMLRLKRELGVDLLKVEGKDFQDLLTLRDAFWCGLIQEDASLTPEQAGDLMDGIGLTKAAEIVGQGLERMVAREVESDDPLGTGRMSPPAGATSSDSATASSSFAPGTSTG